ncbi:glycine-rich cell wall structural protein-like [Dioscorea cayenensis subsp. rotundata]|uniref:Glycine-rich cell wall structural protein-like n=1 Tax=Dioscorea cayennensis subsp. rotundata TaxID=55577 RepID=A0AB40C924_DIOCR|nr:glycine-rich cell wall structural protein-like [Dioscorea cayenensis subsp. rotundata]
MGPGASWGAGAWAGRGQGEARPGASRGGVQWAGEARAGRAGRELGAKGQAARPGRGRVREPSEAGGSKCESGEGWGFRVSRARPGSLGGRGGGHGGKLGDRARVGAGEPGASVRLDGESGRYD